MYKKSKITLLMVLCSISLISIGFSSWTISGTVSENVDGSIEIDQVVSSGNCIKLNTEMGYNGIDDLRYYNTGFIDSTNHVVSTGSFTVHYIIDIDNCKKDLSGISNLKNLYVSFLLLYSDQETDCELLTTYFTDYTIECYSAIDIVDSVPQYAVPICICTKQDSITNTEDKSISLNLGFDSLFTNYTTGEVYFKVSYNFTYSGTNFETDIYNYLFVNKLNFIIKTEIDGS